MYTPTPEKGPGKDSLATRMPLERVVIWSSSTGSCGALSGCPEKKLLKDHCVHTLAIESAALARRLDRWLRARGPTDWTARNADRRILDDNM